MVAECIGIAVVAFRIIAWKDLSAGATGEDVSKRAGTIVRVGTRIAARACCWRSTRTFRTPALCRTPALRFRRPYLQLIDAREALVKREAKTIG